MNRNISFTLCLNWFIPMNHTLKNMYYLILMLLIQSIFTFDLWIRGEGDSIHTFSLEFCCTHCSNCLFFQFFFNLRRATLPFKSANFSSFLFILFSSSPTFLISISGNLMILLNMWVIFGRFVKNRLQMLVFSTPLFHLCVICHHRLLGCMN